MHRGNWRLARQLDGQAAADSDISPEAYAVAGDALAFGSVEAIGFVDAKAKHYVGYSVAAMQSARSIGDEVVFAFGSNRMITDAKLDFKRLIEGNDQVVDLIPLSPTSNARITARDDDPRFTLVIDNKKVFPRLHDVRIHFEPSTGLLAETSDNVKFARIVDGKVTATYALPVHPNTADSVYLTDPKLADGRVAMVVDDNQILELFEADFTGTTIKPSKIIDAPFKVVAIDRAAHVYETPIANTNIRLNNVVFADTLDAVDIQPSPDGRMIAFVDREDIRLFSIDGTLKWKTAAHGRAVAWTPEGNLFAILGGVEMLDLATGEPRSRVCGWGFGISAKPLDDSSMLSDQVCTR